MTTYSLSSRIWNLFWLIVALGPVVVVGRRWLALWKSGQWGDEPGSALFVIGFVGVMFLLTSVGMAWRIHEVRISGTGRIEIARTLTTTGFDARDVRQLEGKYHRGYDNAQEWKLHITWAGGKATIEEFPAVRDFVDRVEALNPTVAITGIWPMGVPESPARSERALP